MLLLLISLIPSASSGDLHPRRPRYQDTSVPGSKETGGCSPGTGQSAPARKKVRLVFADTPEGILSDIQDILKGEVTDPEGHPMREAIFSPHNEHLDKIMFRLTGREDVVEEKPKPWKTLKKSGNKKKSIAVSKMRKMEEFSVKKPFTRKAVFAEEKAPEVEETFHSNLRRRRKPSSRVPRDKSSGTFPG